MSAPRQDSPDRSGSQLEICDQIPSLCDNTLTSRNPQIRGARNSSGGQIQLQNHGGATSEPGRTLDLFEARIYPVSTLSHHIIEDVPFDGQLSSSRASNASDRSMDSFHVVSDANTSVANHVVGSSNDYPLEFEDSPSGRPEGNCEVETMAANQSETVESGGLSVHDFSSSPDESGQSETMVSTPSPDGHRFSSETFTKESDDPHATLLSGAAQQLKPSPSSVLTNWRPIYLQTRVQVAAMCVFFIMAAIVELLLSISLRNDGLATSKEEMRYLWTYGPTALFTLVAAVWVMVAFQAQLVAPWYRLMQAPAKARSFTHLDYFDMIPPVAIFNSLKSRDWVVSTSLSVTLLIRLVIVLSTALINLDLIEVTNTSYPMRVTRKFLDPDEMVKAPSNENLKIIDDGLTKITGGYSKFPDGTSDLYAWETFETEAPVGTEMHTTVTGFSANLTCEPAVAEMRYYLDERGVDDVYPCGMPWITMNISSSVGDCMGTYTNEARTWYGGGRTGPVRFSTLFNDTCQRAGELETIRLFSIFGVVDAILGDFSSGQHCYATHIPQNITLLRSTSLICTPGHSIHKLDLTRNGTSEPIAQLNKNSSSSTLESIRFHPWSIMDTIIASMKSHVRGSPLATIIYRINMVGPEVISDAWTYFVFYIGGATKQHADSMFDSATLEAVLVSYYQKHAAQLAPPLLMKSCNESRKGTVLLLQRRLLVSPWICHVIAGLLVMAGLACLAIGTAPQRKISLSFNPGIPYGMLNAFSHVSGAYPGIQLPLYGSLSPDSPPRELSILPFLAAPTLSHGLRNPSHFKSISGAQAYSHQGLQNVADGRQRIKTPFILRTYLRCFASLAILGIMITLGVTLRESNANHGLGEAGSTLYAHLFWTSLPAVVFSGLSLTIGSMASAVLCLSPYWSMERSANYDGSMGVSLLGELLPISTFRAAKLGFVAAATVATASMLTPWFTIFAPSLFQASYLPTDFASSILTTGSFSTRYPIRDGVQQLMGDLARQLPTTLAFQILKENMSYPASTWENLALPEFSLNGLDSADGLNLINATTKARVPAIRSSLSCEPYKSSQISSALKLGFPRPPSSPPPYIGYAAASETLGVPRTLVVSLTDETCADNMSNNNPLSVTFDTTIESVTPSHASFMAGFGRGASWANREYGLLSGNKIATYGHSCDPFVFIWGHFNMSGDQGQPEIFTSAIACNPTVELVDVNLTFRGPELAMDSLQVDDASVRQTFFGRYLEANVGGLSLFDYGDIRDMFKGAQPQLFDAFASLLTTSPYALTPEDIGDPNKIQQVEDAIKFQYGILQTQHIHVNDRIEAGRTNVTLPNYAATSPDQTTDALTYPAVVTVPNVNRRVVQDPMSTYILEGLLAVVLALTLVSWAFSLSPGVLPGSPKSIANVLFLAASGNLLEFIVNSSDEGSPPDDLFDKYIFWLGSRRVSGSDGVEQERFGIWVLTPKEYEMAIEDSKRSKSASEK